MNRVLAALGFLVALSCATQASAATNAAEVLADETYAFCHDSQYPLTVREAAWCPLYPASGGWCPALPAACKAPRAAFDGEPGPFGERRVAKDGEVVRGRSDGGDRSRGGGSRSGRGRGGAGAGAASDEPDPDEGEVTGLGPIAHVLVWIIVGAMVIALLSQLRMGKSAALPPSAARKRDAAPEPADDAITRAARETDVDRLLARAQMLADRGEYAEAIADAYAALLRRLAERGRIQLLPSRTNGDHVRDLHEHPAVQASTREVVMIVERLQFGHAPGNRELFDKVIARVRSMLSSLVVVLLLVWIGLACQSDAVRSYPWASSPSGTQAVLELLRGNDIEVSYRVAPIVDLPQWGPMIVVLDTVELEDREWTELLRAVQDGGVAVLATTGSLPGMLGIGPRDRLEPRLSEWTDDEVGVSLEVAVPDLHGLVLRDDAWLALLTDPAGIPYAATRAHGRGRLVVIADDRLFENAALAIPDNGAFLVRLLRWLDRDVQLIDAGVLARTVEGGSDDPFDAIERANLTPAILQLLAFVALLYLWRGAHFGRPHDPPPPSRRRFTEHVGALAEHYARARAKRHALRLYASWAIERVHERFGGHKRGLHRLARRIAARTGRDETEIMRVLVEAHDAREDVHDGQGTDDDLRALRELGRLVESTRGKA